jgi:hypothetical protein
MYTIRLSKNQVHKRKKFNHPLLQDVKGYTLEEIQPLVDKRLLTGECDELILALRVYLKFIVGCYLYYWPETTNMTDDMVSVGLGALVRLVKNLTVNELEGRNIFKLVSLRLRCEIEEFVNKERGICLPSLKQQKRLRQKNIEFKGFVESDENFNDETENNAGFEYVDTMEVLQQVSEGSEIFQYLMKEENRYRPSRELAKELGVSKSKVADDRKKFYRKYKNAT